MPEVVILVGKPGSGKSSYFKQNLVDTHIRINLDMLSNRGRNRNARKKEACIFTACMLAKQSCVIDNTNPSASDRARYINDAKKHGFTVTVIEFRIHTEEAVRRNRQRRIEEQVPYVAYKRYDDRYQIPSLSEGMDALTVNVI